MGFRLSFGIGPIRYSAPLTGRRSRRPPRAYQPPEPIRVPSLPAPPPVYATERDRSLDMLQDFHARSLITDEEYWTIQRRIIDTYPE